MAKIYLLNNATHTQILSLLIVSGDTVVAVDGGTRGDADNFIACLSRFTGDTHIDAWFLTHPHHDHINVANICLSEHPEVRVDGVYHHFPPLSYLEEMSTRGEAELVAYKRFLSDGDGRCHTVERGDVLTFGDITVEVMRTFNPTIRADATNNSSAVYKVTVGGKTLLVLGDLGVEGGYDLMAICRAEELRCDFTQMAHHGQSGADEVFYRYIRPKACLWPTPDWLWDNDMGEGFDTGPYKTVRTRAWMDDLGASVHYVEKDGPVEIVMKNEE